MLTCVEQMMTGEMDVVRQALKRSCQWRIPFNWTRAQWREEISAEAELGMIEHSHEIELESHRTNAHLQSIIQNKLLKRYRQEWAFSKHFCSQLTNNQTDSDRPEPENMYLRLQEAMSALSEMDRILIQQLYWEKRKETQIATETGVDVSTICKRKKRILLHLRDILKNLED